MSLYTKIIVELTGCDAADAPLVEGLMRTTYGTLDGLDRARFRREARAALKDAKADRETATSVARSYGLIR